MQLNISCMCKCMVLSYCSYIIDKELEDEILPRVDYSCWKMYVKACGLVCSKAITLDAVGQCHDYFLAFCKKFGGELCTPNMYLHCHIQDCLVD